MALGVDQLSWTTRARACTSAVLTSCPGRLVAHSEHLRCRAALPGDSHSYLRALVSTNSPGESRSCPRAHGVDKLSQVRRDRVRGLRCRPALLGESNSYLRARGVNEPSQATRARVRGPRCRPALPGDSRSYLRAHRVDQLSQATRARVRGPAVSTSSPGPLGPVSAFP